MKFVPSAALLLPLLCSMPALANDGIAGVSAGGIVFGKTDAIAMKKEVLSVSFDKIVVDYDFVNESAAPVEETIAFPLPPYSAAYHDSDTYYGQPGGFSIHVDGRDVDFKTVLRATIDGKDVTPRLRQLGLSDEQIAYFPSASPFDKKVKQLSGKQQKDFIAEGLLAKLGAEEEFVPAWEVQINYVWKQVFAPNKTVHVRHQYAPFVDGGPGASSIGEKKDFIKSHCGDQDFFNAWNRLHPKENSYVAAAWVSYILKTGNTWKNGIEDFTLNLVKKDPKEIVSLCFPGKFVKINPTTLQVRLRNFKPTQDLAIFFGNIEGGADNQGVMPKLKH